MSFFQTPFSVLLVAKIVPPVPPCGVKLSGEEKLAPSSLCFSVFCPHSSLENSSHVLFLVEEFFDMFPPPNPSMVLLSFHIFLLVSPSSIISSSFAILSIPRMRLWMMIVCPPRSSSRMMASRMTDSFHLVTMVSIGFFCLGGVVRSDIFLSPESARLSDRGIGVAESARISRFAFIFFIFSLCVTQNLCSSSMMRSPSRFHTISSEMSL